MTLKLNEKNGVKLLEAQLSGTLVKEDYAHFTPTVDRLVKEHGKIRLLIEMHDFHGWTAGAACEDLSFGIEHFNDIERIAIVGETQWEHGMALFCKPFTRAQVRYFDHIADKEARAWIEDA
jgi:hypothetical protein